MSKYSFSFQWAFVFSVLIICFGWVIVTAFGVNYNSNCLYLDCLINFFILILFLIFFLCYYLYYISKEESKKELQIKQKNDLLKYLDELRKSCSAGTINEDEYSELKKEIFEELKLKLKTK